jgi:hypothetical protein
MFNIYLGIYITAAILVIAGGTFKFFGKGQQIAALLFLAGSILVFSVYGIRWFGSSNSIFSKTPVTWPPMINTCPDYLVYYKRPKADGTHEDTCVDKLGISRNGSLKVFPGDGNVNNANDEYFFSLQTQSSDPTQRLAELCKRTLTYGLTWEGVSNGESCVAPNVNPVPPSGGGSSNNCPQ